MKKLKQNQKGFTLIELLVVIAIIGLLASVVLLALNSARKKSRDARRVADARQIATALELYYDGNNGYPPTATHKDDLTPDYLGQWPTYPTPAGTCSALADDYTYTSTSTDAFVLTFCLEGDTGDFDTGNNTITEQGINPA